MPLPKNSKFNIQDKTDLKYQVSKLGSKFFDRGAMRFFGDTMGNYYLSKVLVDVTDLWGKVHVCYALQRIKATPMGQTKTMFFSIEDLHMHTHHEPDDLHPSCYHQTPGQSWPITSIQG